MLPCAINALIAHGRSKARRKFSGFFADCQQSLKGAAAGEGRLPTEVVRRVFDRIRSRAKSKEEVDLTPREKEILVSFCRGMSYVAIAEAREVKVVTIRNAIYTIQVKMGVASKQEIVVWAVRNGLLDD